MRQEMIQATDVKQWNWSSISRHANSFEHLLSKAQDRINIT